jgi:hypothetical protein
MYCASTFETDIHGRKLIKHSLSVHSHTSLLYLSHAQLAVDSIKSIHAAVHIAKRASERNLVALVNLLVLDVKLSRSSSSITHAEGGVCCGSPAISIQASCNVTYIEEMGGTQVQLDRL